MRCDLDVTDTAFPYFAPTTAYVLVRDSGEVTQVQPGSEIAREIKTGTARLFAVWPGQWRSDVFTIDPDGLLAALGRQAAAAATAADASRQAEIENRRFMLSLECPVCKAAPGKPCETNNAVTEVAWFARKYNLPSSGAARAQAEFRRRLVAGESQAAVAREYKTPVGDVGRICRDAQPRQLQRIHPERWENQP